MNTEKQIRNYIQRQNNWIKANDLKPGDKVLVKRVHSSYTKGWENPWCQNERFNMDDLVNKKLTVLSIKERQSGIAILPPKGFDDARQSSWLLPYTILQKVE